MAEEWALPDDAIVDQLQAWVEVARDESGWNAHLFKNDYHPVPGVLIGDLVEANFGGYSAQAIIEADWGDATVTDNGASSENATAVTFTHSSAPTLGQTVYGYYVTNGGAELVWVVRFATPRVIYSFDKLTVKLVNRLANLPAA